MNIEDHIYQYLSVYKTMPDWAKKSIVIPFKILPRHFYMGKFYKYFYQEAKSTEIMDQNEVAEYQFLKLKKLLEHCYKYVPFYKQTWNKYGINLKNIQSLEDFSSTIPNITREMIQKKPTEFVSDNYSDKNKLPMNTGGSTGVPLSLYYLKGYSRGAEWAHMHVQWERVGFKAGKRLARLRGDYIGKDKLFAFDPWRNYLILSSFNLNSKNANQYLNLLRKYKVEFINAYPSSLYNLIQLSEFNTFEIPSLKVIMLGSENVFEWQLKKIKEFFGVNRIYYWYGHGELCALGGGCEVSNNYHFFPSYSYVEFINNEDLSDSDENLNEIVGTSFINPLMPLIRYRTQDYGIEATQKCKCGRNLKILKRILGREQDIAVGLNGEKITLTALIFGRHADYFNHVIKLQIINEYPGKLIVKVKPKTTFESYHKKEIVDTLSQREGMPFEAKVEIVESIMSTKRGKHKFFIRNFDLH